jgi:hypothetical protein
MNRSLRRLYKGKKEHRKAAYICIFSTPSNFVSLSSPSSFGCSLSPYTRTRDKARLFPHFDWVCSSILLFTDGNRFIFRALWQLIDTKMGKWSI